MPLNIADVPQPKYEAASFEARLLMPDRVNAMCKDLFNLLVETGGPEQKTIIFCTRDDHADKVATEMNNLYEMWRVRAGARPAPTDMHMSSNVQRQVLAMTNCPTCAAVCRGISSPAPWIC